MRKHANNFASYSTRASLKSLKKVSRVVLDRECAGGDRATDVGLAPYIAEFRSLQKPNTNFAFITPSLRPVDSSISPFITKNVQLFASFHDSKVYSET